MIATRQIGDVLLTTPLIREARILWPDARIDVLGFIDTLGMLEGNPDIDRQIAMPSRSGVLGLLRFLYAQRLLRRYDLALVTQSSDRAHLLGFVAAATRLGVVSPDLKTSWWKRLLLRRWVVLAGDRGTVHVIDEKLALLDPWIQPGPRKRDVTSTPATALPSDLLLLLRERFVVVHVPSMWHYKQWPVEHFTNLVTRLSERGFQVLLTGGPSVEDREMTAEVSAAVNDRNVIDLGGRLEFGQLTSMLRRASLFIGPDTSVTHLAAATGTLTIALFGPTNPVRWGPRAPSATGGQAWRPVAAVQRRASVILMQGPGNCVPCGRAGCDDHRQSRSLCLEGLTPDRVATVALDMLQQSAKPASAELESGS